MGKKKKSGNKHDGATNLIALITAIVNLAVSIMILIEKLAK